MEDLKNQVEAILFSAGKNVEAEEISRLCRASFDEVSKVLQELKKEYNYKNSSMMLIEEGASWKLTIREKYLPIIQNIVTETEMTKTVMETLAVIAFKYPIKQADLIKIRTNKAYDHLKELEQLGYISKQKHGRTFLIKLTEKFFEYFDLPRDKLKEKFKDFESIAKTIEEKEKEIENLNEKKKREEEEKNDKKTDEKEINLVDDEGNKQKLEIVDEPSRKSDIEPYVEELDEIEVISDKEKLDNLEVIDEPEDYEESSSKTKEIFGEKKMRFGKGIETTADMEKIIDEKVEEIMHPKKESSKEETEEEKESEETEEEPKDLLEAEQEKKKKKKN